MKINLKTSFLFFVIIGANYESFSKENKNNIGQQTYNVSNPFQQNATHIQIGIGLNKMQDLATSPLIYQGTNIDIGIGRTWMTKRNSEILIQLNGGTSFLNTNPESQKLSTSNNATMFNAQIGIGYLYNLTNALNSRFDVKIGGKFDTWWDLRINQNHMNNALGYEGMFNLMGSGKLEYYLNNEVVKKSLFLVGHIGLININNRPGYNYNNTMPLISEEKSKDETISRNWSNNGFRMQIEMGLKINRFKGYVQTFSYGFEGIKTKGKYDPFGYISHRIKYTITLNRNN